MQAKIEGRDLVIRIPLHAPRSSKSGKSDLVATTSGPKATEAQIDGKPIVVVLSAYIRREPRE